ncbi:MAG: ATP-dependent helicase, partial [Sedimentibacter sp.]
PETYVHRIGRTGRAGLGGTAIAFCEYEEKPFLRDIQKLIKKTIKVVEDHPYPMLIHTVAPKAAKSQSRHRIERVEPEFARSKKSNAKTSSYRGTSNKTSSKKPYNRNVKNS